VDISPNIIKASFDSGLKQGTLFRLKGNDPFRSDDYHVFIVLNYNPDTNEALILVNGTTKIEKRLDNLNKLGVDTMKTTVRINAGKYSFFPKETMIDCNSVHTKRITMDDFRLKNILPIDGCLEDDDFEKIVSAVLESKQVPDNQKSLIRKDL
jgi:hypothetical protein